MAGPPLTHVCLAQVVVVQAISALCQKYPRKHAVLMNFLFSMLREEVRAGRSGAGSPVRVVAWPLAPRPASSRVYPVHLLAGCFRGAHDP